jgi:hypothetical protein
MQCFIVVEADGISQLGSHSALADVGFLWTYCRITARRAGSQKGQEELIAHC